MREFRIVVDLVMTNPFQGRRQPNVLRVGDIVTAGGGAAPNARAMEVGQRTVPLAKDSWAYAQKVGAVREQRA